MYNRIFKNHQVNVGNPFQVKIPLSMHAVIKQASIPQHAVNDYTEESEGDNISAEQDAYKAEKLMEELLEKAKEEAELIIKEAHYEAARMMDEAQQQAEELKAKALEESYKAGFEEGKRTAAVQYEEMLAQASELKQQAQQEYTELMAGIEADAVAIIADITRKIIGDELETSREYILHIINQALNRCSNRENLILRISPIDYDYIIENREKLASMVDNPESIDIRRDVSLKDGDCLLETTFGTIDAGLKTRLVKIEEAFRQAVMETDRGGNNEGI